MSPEPAAGDRTASQAGLSLAARALLARRATLSSAGVVVPAIAPRSDHSGPAPLSSWQQSIWFFDQMEPGRDAYNRSKMIRLSGLLNVAALESSVAEIFRRHEVLRSHVTMHNGNPAQCVMDGFEATLDVIDLGALSPAARETRRGEVVNAASHAPFDLASGPWARAVLIRESAVDHELLFTAHHIAFDGWSTAIFVAELAELYSGVVSDAHAPPEGLTFQYADFAESQRARLGSGALDADLDYWFAQLDGAPSLLELPADHPRSATRSNIAATASTVIPATIAERLAALGREENATQFMTLFAAFQLLVSRLSGCADVVTGIPVAGRTCVAAEGMIGCFINLLPIRTRIGEDLSFRKLLRDVRSTVVGAFAHQDAPFDAIVDRIQPVRSLSHTPVTQVLFNFRNTPAADPVFAGLDAELTSVASESLVSDFEIEIGKAVDGLHVSVHYNAELFDASTVERWLGHFRMLLDGVVAAPDDSVSRIPLLSAFERARITIAWNSVATAPDYETCVHRLVESQVHRTPEATAVVDGAGALTYAELNRRANILARDLIARGVGPDVLVAINMQRCPDLIVALLGILKAGGAYVPLDPGYPADRLEYMLSDSRPAVIVTQRAFARTVNPGSTPVICVDADYWTHAPHYDGADVASKATPDSLAYVIYTSGSTGRPKGAMVSHRGVCNLLLRARDLFRLTADDVVLQRSSFSFDASVREVFATLIAGGRLALADPSQHADVGYIAAAIEQYGVTVICVVPTLLQLLLDVPAVSRKCASVRLITSGGEALVPALQQRCFAELNATLFNAYGPTETSVFAIAWQCERGATRRSVPLGRPIANVQIYIVDKHLQPVPIGVAGEICIGGVGVGPGYVNQPELTAERFVADQFRGMGGAKVYRTGDLGMFDQDGIIEFLGRMDHQVKLRGIRMELGEIEFALAAVDGVRECAVVVRDDAPGGRGLVAYVVATGNSELSPRTMREALAAKLVPAMVPSTFVAVDALPLTPSGKVDRRSLPVPLQPGPHAGDESLRPKTPTEDLVARIWADVLKREFIGVDDDFFALGGHSLNATQVISRIRDKARIDAPLKLLFEHPTVRSFAGAVDELALSAQSDEQILLLLAKLEEAVAGGDPGLT